MYIYENIPVVSNHGFSWLLLVMEDVGKAVLSFPGNIKNEVTLER